MRQGKKVELNLYGRMDKKSKWTINRVDKRSKTTPSGQKSNEIYTHKRSKWTKSRMVKVRTGQEVIEGTESRMEKRI